MENNTTEDIDKDEFLNIDTETKDWTLEIILGVIESDAERNFDFPITLNVGGLVIIGNLISEREFLQKVMYGKLYQKYEQGMKEIDSSEKDNDVERFNQPKVYRFIHLKNARYYTGTVTTDFPEGLLWRGLLTSVDGYFLK
jgi:hypothetical protein